MRPLSLTVEGFACFSERQPPLDFRNLHLFSIAGPTGAGKSSILDAMMFALYGYVPRLGKAGADLITTGRDRLAVEFEFSVGDRAFRISRTLRRKQGARVVLEETTGTKTRPVSDKVSDANAEIERLLGIGYEGFSQSVVLPQGKFDTFLRDSGGDRRQLLKDLLGLERYERMRKAAVERRAAVGSEVAALEQVLKGCADATEERLAAAREDLEEAGQAASRGRETERAAAARLAEIRRRRDLTVDLERRRCELARVDAGAAEIAMATAALDAARRAAPVVPVLDAARAAEERRLAAEAARRKAADTEKEAAATLRQAARAAQKAERDARRIGNLRERVSALHRIHGSVVRLKAAAAKQEALGAAAAGAQKDVDAAGRRLAEAQDARTHATVSLADARQALERVGYDAARHDVLQPLLAEAMRAAEVASRLEDARASLGRAHDELVHAQSASGRAAAAETEARNAVEAAARTQESCETELSRTTDAEMAAVLRRGLCEGEACPVCDRTVERVPPAIASPALDAVAARCDAARRACGEARAELTARERDAHAALAVAEERRKGVERLQAEATLLAEQLTQLDERLGAALAGIGARGVAIEMRQWVIAETTRLGTLRREADAASQAVSAAEKAWQLAQNALVTASHELDRARERLEKAERERLATALERDTLAREIAAVTTADDPDQERAALDSQISALERAIKTTSDALREAGASYSAAEATLREASSRLEIDRLEAERLAADATAAVRLAGFAGEDASRKAVLTGERVRALEQQITEHRDRRQQLAARVDELTRELGEERADDGAVDTAAQEHERAKHEHAQAVDRRAAARAGLDQLEKSVKKAEEIRSDLAARRRTLDIADLLSRELGGDRFQQYLLEDTLVQLVQGASVRLKELSGRYTLEWHDDRFHVIDHDNARERRIAHTLSGGETFLASLSLALELSDQIQRSAGVVRIDSLFIDEGFGTLDPDTLGVVSEAIEALQVGGRMVGIITHLEELTERLPGCVRVAKRPAQGSTWCVERSA